MGSSDRLTVIATGAAIVVAIVGSTCSTNARIDEVHTSLNARIDRLEARIDGIDGRLRGVEIAFGQVDRRLATLERALLPAPRP